MVREYFVLTKRQPEIDILATGYVAYAIVVFDDFETTNYNAMKKFLSDTALHGYETEGITNEFLKSMSVDEQECLKHLPVIYFDKHKVIQEHPSFLGDWMCIKHLGSDDCEINNLITHLKDKSHIEDSYSDNKRGTRCEETVMHDRGNLTKRKEIPIWEKLTLTIEEAAVLFRIGENKLRKIAGEHPNSDFLIWNGNRPQIKRKMFEEYLEKCNAI